MRDRHGRESGRPPELAPEPSHPHVVVPEQAFPWKRAAKKVATAAGLGAVFVFAAAGGLLLHVDLPPARRLVAGVVNELLGGTFRGKIGIVRVSRLAPDGIDGGVLTLSDPDGRQVALLEGVRARISLGPLLASLIAGRDLRVPVTELSIDHVDALLAEGADGALGIASAFQPAEAGPPPPPKKNSGGLDLRLAKIRLKHAWIHGAMSGAPPIDADVDDVAASFTMDPERMTVDLGHLRAMTRGMPGRNVAAEATGHLVLPADPAEKMSGAGKIVGAVGGIGLHAEGKIEGAQVDATLDVPQIDPGLLSDAVGSPVLTEGASVHVEAHGALPHVDPVVHLTVGSGTVDVQARMTLPSEGQSDLLAQVNVAARNLDARAASATGPASKIGLDASAEVRLAASGAIDGKYDLHLLPGAVAGQATPDARIAGTFAPTSVRGAGHIAEPGMPADVRFDVNPVAQEITFDAKVNAPDLTKVSRLGGNLRGCASIHAQGKVGLAARQVKAKVDATVDRIDQGGVTVGHADLSASADGALERPLVVFALAGNDLHAGKYVYPVFHATVDGPLGALHVGADLGGGADAQVKLVAVVDAARGVSARDVVLAASKGKDAITARVADARVEGGRVDARGIRLEGAGAPVDGEVHLRPGSFVARVTAPQVNVPTLLRVAGIQSELRSGDVGLDIDLDAGAHATSGHANVSLRNVAYGKNVSGVEANLATSFDGDAATLHLDAHDATRSTVTIDTRDGKLAGGALAPRSWERATGQLHGAVNVDLQRVNAVFGGSRPFEKLKGTLAAQFDVGRDDARTRPTLAIDAATRGLVITAAPSTVDAGGGTAVAVGRTIHSRGVDAHLNAKLDAQSGETTLAFEVTDKAGPIVAVKGGTTLPMDPLVAGDTAAAREALLGTPVTARVEVPLRSLDSVPLAAAMVPVRGQVGLTLDATGTARTPNVKLAFQARGLEAAGDPTPHPLGLDGSIVYDGEAARAVIVAQSGAAKVLDVKGTLALRARDLLGGGAAPWEASGDVAFDRFPIGALTGLMDENAIDGDLSGAVTLRDLHKAGALDVKLDLANIDINGTKFGDTTAAVAVRDGALTADAELKQKDGFARVHAATGMKWGTEVAPSLDEKAAFDLGLRAQNFRLAMIAPFVRSAVSELDGRLNADTKIHVLPGMKDGTMDGAIVLDKGLFETPSIGQEFHDLKARVFMKPWGMWNVQEISASGTTGHFTANAQAKMNGFQFESGEAHLKITEGDKLPLTMQGISYGTIWGNVDTKAKLARDGQTIDIDVNVPSLHINLPESIGHSVQSTDPDPTVRVGAIADDGTMTILPIDGSAPPQKPSPSQKAAASGPTATPRTPTKLHVATHLGPDFEVRRTGMLRVYVAHGPTVDIGSETKISGDILLPRGYVELQGKRFQVEKAAVNFTGQAPDNPVVVATAYYDSPDGTRVLADFVGPVKTGKVTLRSEPALSQNEILALLLFGTADGTFGQAAPQGQEGNNVTQAASLAGGVVTEGLNKAISGVSGIEVQTKVDTQESGDPRPEVEVALSRDVSATVIYNLGVPPPGQNPDDTLLVVDWRFHRNYSTEATLGDKGTSILDLTWKYRY